MSFAAYHTLRLYAKWREAYLRGHPEKRLIPLLLEDVESVPVPEEPIITLGPAGVKLVEDVKKGGVLAALVVLLLLASTD